MTRPRWALILALGALLLPAASGAVPIRITSGLVGEWHLQTSVIFPNLEIAPDTSGYGRTGLVTGARASSWGWLYTGVDLTGDKFVSVANSANLNFGTGSFTLAAWIRMADTSRFVKTIIDNRGTDGRGYSFAVYGGDHLLLQMADETGWTNFNSTGTLSRNRWHHVAVTVDRTAWPVHIAFYIDGTQVGIATPKMGNVNNTNLPFYIGGHKDTSSYRFSDRLDEVLVYNRALADWEIWEILNPGRPSFTPSFWNGNSRQGANNCYNYANDQATNTFAQPGRASGAQNTTMTCAAAIQAVINDGLESLGTNYPNPILNFKTGIALVVAPGYDYHFYRLDDNGTWTHKPGGTAATNVDNSGNVITDPRTANRGVYTDFCGFFRIWSDISEGYGHEHIQ